MTEAVVASRKLQIDRIVEGVKDGDRGKSLISAGWKLVGVSGHIGQDAVMNLMIPSKGVTEAERAELHAYCKAAFKKLRG